MTNASGLFAKRFNFFQIAYVATDIDQAVEVFARDYGIPSFAVSRDVQIDTRGGKATLHFALAYVGGQQIELIQPAAGADRPYREALPTEGFAIRLHHLGHLVTREEEWNQIKTAIAVRGLDTPVAGVFGDLMHYLYADTRNELGHYLEYMYQTEAGRDMFAHVPRY